MKINKYKLKEKVAINDILDNGFEYSLDKKYLTKFKSLHDSITLTIKMPLVDIYSFDFYNDVDILDEDFLQPYMPFYDNYNKDVIDRKFLKSLIKRYNEEMDEITIFEIL